MEKIKILTVDDSAEACSIFQKYCLLTNDLECCGTANNGEEALYKIKKLHPDVVLLDMVLPALDGLSILEHEHSQDSAPYFIVTSGIINDKYTAEALRLGASYYMMKPYKLRDLHRRIQILMDPGRPTDRLGDIGPEFIAKMVMDLGVPTHVLGYKYVMEGLQILLTQKDVYPFSTQVYEQIARNHETTKECVESALRKTITRVFSQENQMIQAVFGEGKKPTNAQFLTKLAEKIKLDAYLLSDSSIVSPKE